MHLTWWFVPKHCVRVVASEDLATLAVYHEISFYNLVHFFIKEFEMMMLK